MTANSDDHSRRDSDSDETPRAVTPAAALPTGDRDTLARVLDAVARQSYPPVQRWHPPLSGDLDLVISANGTWRHEQSPILRQSLVKLLASILRREDDDYFLVSPTEKWRIVVEDAPFVAVELDILSSNDDGLQRLAFRTNVDDLVIAGRAHPLWIEQLPGSDAPRPYLRVRGGLNALISRPVFYQLIDHAKLSETQTESLLHIESNGEVFVLGSILDRDDAAGHSPRDGD